MARQPFLGVPEGQVKVENPDGVLRRDGSHSAWDTGGTPFPIQSGDFQTRQVRPKPGNDPTT